MITTIRKGVEKQAEADVDFVIRHWCTLKVICALNDELKNF